jgi:hypothetical protein
LVEIAQARDEIFYASRLDPLGAVDSGLDDGHLECQPAVQPSAGGSPPRYAMPVRAPTRARLIRLGVEELAR